MTPDEQWVFPPPYRMRDAYRARVLPRDETEKRGWPKSRVVIERATTPTDPEPALWDEVTTYDRNYSLLGTFEPFRQLRDGVWREYALISKRYTKFEVISLDTGETVAVEAPSEAKVQRARELQQEYITGKHKDATSEYAEAWRTEDPVKLAESWGFCPVEFYVPDFWDSWWEPSDRESLEQARNSLVRDWEAGDRAFEDENLRYTGDFALYSGCAWGDDSSWKLQYIDLSKISDGVATGDDRFGYVELPRYVKLRDAVTYWDETDTFEIAVSIGFSRSGKASNFNKKWINWDADNNEG